MVLPTQALLGEPLANANANNSPAEKTVEHKAVSPASRRGSVGTDDGNKASFEAPRDATYQFLGQPLPVPLSQAKGGASATTAASLAAQYQQTAMHAAHKAASTRQQTHSVVTATEETTLEDEDEEEEELDWRDQLYYWTGILYFEPARSLQVWKGSWVGSYSGKPMPEEFSWSFNHFEYTSDGGRATPMMGPDGTLQPQSGPLQGYYLMDNDGSGALQRYVDNEYVVEFEALPNLVGGGLSEQYAVYGRGDSDFGEFIVTGNYNKRTRFLEMTRQYIAETDVRSRMPLPQLKTLMRMQR
jgi:hypothetical protein